VVCVCFVLFFCGEFYVLVFTEVLILLRLGASPVSDRVNQLEAELRRLLRPIRSLEPPARINLAVYSSYHLMEFIRSWMGSEFASAEIAVPAHVVLAFCTAVNYLLLTNPNDQDRKLLKTMLQRIADCLEENCDDVEDVHEMLRNVLSADLEDNPFGFTHGLYPKMTWTLPSGQKQGQSVRDVENFFSEFFFIQWDQLHMRFKSNGCIFREATTAFQILHGLEDQAEAGNIRRVVRCRSEFLLRNPSLLYWGRAKNCFAKSGNSERDLKLLHLLLTCVSADRSDPDMSLECDRQVLDHLPNGPILVDSIFFIARLYTFQGRFDGAVKFLERTLAGSTNLFVLYPCHFGLASLKLHMGDESSSVRHFARYFAFVGPMGMNFRCIDESGIPHSLRELFRCLRRRIYDSTDLWTLGSERTPASKYENPERAAQIQLNRRILPYDLDYKDDF
jgi:hypothetical protein